MIKTQSGYLGPSDKHIFINLASLQPCCRLEYLGSFFQKNTSAQSPTINNLNQNFRCQSNRISIFLKIPGWFKRTVRIEHSWAGPFFHPQSVFESCYMETDSAEESLEAPCSPDLETPCKWEKKMETVLKINKKNVTKCPERQHHVWDTCRPEHEHRKSLCTWSSACCNKLVIEQQVEERKRICLLRQRLQTDRPNTFHK